MPPEKLITRRAGVGLRAVIAMLFVLLVVACGMRVWGLDRPAPYRAYVQPWGQDGPPTVLGFRSPEDSLSSELRVGDRILAVGGHDLDGLGQLDFLARLADAAWETDGAVSFVVDRGGERITVAESRPSPARGPGVAFLLIALAYGTVAGLIAWKAPRTLSNHLLVLFMVIFGLTHVNVLQGPAPVFWFSVGLMGVSIITMPVGILALLGIPPEVGSLRGWSFVWPWLFLLIDVLQYVQHLAFPLDPGLAFALTRATFPVFMVTAGSVLVFNYRMSSPAGKRQVKWAILGIWVGIVAALINVYLHGWKPDNGPPLWVALHLLSTLPFPVALYISVSRFDMLDVDRLIGAAVGYNVLGVVVVGAGLVLFPLLTDFLAASMAIDPAVGRTAIAFGMAGIIVLAQRRLSPRIDRMFFNERFALDQAMKEIPELLASARGPDDLWTTVGQELMEAVRPTSCVFYTRGAGTFTPQFVGGATTPQEVTGDGRFTAWVSGLTGAVRLDRYDTKGLDPLGRAVFDSLATHVVVPVHRSGELAAFICLGDKRSGDIYTRTDLTLLTTLAKTMSVHLMRFTDAELLQHALAIQEKMRRYVPGALAKEIELGRELETGEREVSVLFVDIRGYTAFAQDHATGDVFSTINRYTETVSAIVHEAGGVVVEFNGDGMMAVFGAPRRLDDKERAAVDAGCRLVEKVPVVGGDQRVDVGVGIATGIAYVGNIEAVDRTIWSALGNPTNLAARLQGMTRDLGTTVLIDALTHTRSGGAAADFVSKGEVEIRGRKELETLFGLPSESGRPASLQR